MGNLWANFLNSFWNHEVPTKCAVSLICHKILLNSVFLCLVYLFRKKCLSWSCILRVHRNFKSNLISLILAFSPLPISRAKLKEYLFLFGFRFQQRGFFFFFFLHSDCRHSLTKAYLNAGKCHLQVKKLTEASLSLLNLWRCRFIKPWALSDAVQQNLG
jgi:hypothetical protein